MPLYFVQREIALAALGVSTGMAITFALSKPYEQYTIQENSELIYNNVKKYLSKITSVHICTTGVFGMLYLTNKLLFRLNAINSALNCLTRINYRKM